MKDSELIDFLHKPHVKVDVIARTFEQGGRRSPIFSGYRPNCWIGNLNMRGERTYSDALVVIEGKDMLQPGEGGSIWLVPLAPESWRNVHVGAEIDLCEGHKVVAHGRVVESNIG